MAKSKDTFTLSLFEELSLQVDPPQKAAAGFAVVADKDVDEAKNYSICADWKWCTWGAACMTPENDETGHCYKENTDNLPLTAMSRDEIKVFAAGYSLVKYLREKKIVRVSAEEPENGWIELGPFATYSQAERKVKELRGKGYVECNEIGTISMSGGDYPGLKSLRALGFEFYRVEGITPGHGTPRIKIASKNWGTFVKYTTREEVKKAWEELLQDPKSLEG